jgi:hypothetical protein
MALGRVTEVRNHIARHQDVHRCTDGVQAAKDMQRVVLEAGKRASREEQVDRDAFGQRMAAGHFRDASSERRVRAGVRAMET